MATETRVVRPFPIPAAVEEFINSARLHVGDLTLELNQISGLEMFSDVVVGEEGDTSLGQPGPDGLGNTARKLPIAVAVSCSAVGNEGDGGSHKWSFRRRRRTA